MSVATTPHTLSIAGTALSLFISGGISSISLLTVPIILAQPISTPQLLQIWKATYDRGKSRAPLIASAAGILHLSSAYLVHSYSGIWPVASIVAAVATMAIGPFTLVVMGSTNEKLIRAADTGTEAGKDGTETRALVERWGVLNLVRGMLPLVGGVFALMNLSSF